MATLEAKVIATNCGCRVVVGTSHADLEAGTAPTAAIDYCDLHLAAGKLRDELALVYDQIKDADAKRPGSHSPEFCQWCRIGAILAAIKS
jgi:hypothetical protein